MSKMEKTKKQKQQEGMMKRIEKQVDIPALTAGLSAEYVRLKIIKYLTMDNSTLLQCRDNPTIQSLDLIIIAIIQRAYTTGDHVRLDNLLSKVNGHAPGDPIPGDGAILINGTSISHEKADETIMRVCLKREMLAEQARLRDAQQSY